MTLLENNVSRKLPLDKMNGRINADAFGYVEELYRVINKESAAGTHVILTSEEDSMATLVQHARQCLNCKTGTNSDTNVTFVDPHRLYLLIKQPDSEKSETDMLAGLHIIQSPSLGKRVAIIPDIPYGTVSTSYVEALLTHLLTKAGKLGVSLYIPEVVSKYVNLADFVRSWQEDPDWRVHAEPQPASITLPASAAGQTYYEYNGRFQRVHGETVWDISGSLLSITQR